MQNILYQVADVFFFAFHTALILFNMFGWIPGRFRRYHLITLSLTVFSWVVLGIWYGWGYCACTDWHWSVREHLGYSNETNSYIGLLLIKLTGLKFAPSLVDKVSVIVLVVCVVLSVVLNIRDFRKGRWKRRPGK